MPESQELIPANHKLDAAISELATDTAKAKGRRVVLSTEMAAIADIEVILGSLPQKARTRVLAWVNASHGDCGE